jgi:hypothetical protein
MTLPVMADRAFFRASLAWGKLEAEAGHCKTGYRGRP